MIFIYHICLDLFNSWRRQVSQGLTCKETWRKLKYDLCNPYPLDRLEPVATTAELVILEASKPDELNIFVHKTFKYFYH